MPTDSRFADPPVAGPAPILAAKPLPLSYATDQRATRFRWFVLFMIFLAITINYIDRMVLGVLAPTLNAELGISKSEYGYITAAFGISYALGQTLSGRWLDWIGTRIGYAIALASWSVASMLHAFPRTAFGFGVARALLGVTESPAYPAATKTLAEWFPRRERAFAMGVVNAGANIGAVVGPWLVTHLAINYGWKSAFIVTGAIGFLWLLLWIPFYRRPHEHPRVNAAELAYINQDALESTGKVRWLSLLGTRQAWGFMLGKALTDPIWSFYLFWLPMFLKDQHKLSLSETATGMIVVYLIADVGSIGGGWMSSAMIKRGWSVNAARKATLLTCALLTVPAVMVSLMGTPWPAILLCGLALAAHQGFSSNLYTLVSDVFPKRAVGSVAGLGGTCGYLGTAAHTACVGVILQMTGNNYLPVFVTCGTFYLIAFAAIQILMPRLEPANVGNEPDSLAMPPPVGGR